MKKTLLAITTTLALSTGLTGCVDGALNPTSMAALQDAYTAATLSEGDAKAMAVQAAAQIDQKNTLLSGNNAYSKRLTRLTAPLQNADGLNLNFAVYDDKAVNAFAMADGTIRVYRGLLDNFSDDEVRFVLAHEIGHVKLGHSLNAMRTAYATSAVRKGAASTGGKLAELSASQLGGLAQKLVNAQFSQSQELAADRYAVTFMQRNSLNARAGLSVMQKFQQMDGGKGSIFSSHPASTAREDQISKLL